jgi:hypothetical protein
VGQKQRSKEYYQKLWKPWKYGDNDLLEILKAKEFLKGKTADGDVKKGGVLSGR